MVGVALGAVVVGGSACIVYALWWTLRSIRQACDQIGR